MINFDPGLQRGKNGRWLRKLNYEEVYNFKQNGLSYSKLAKMFDCSEYALKLAVKKHKKYIENRSRDGIAGIKGPVAG